MIPFSHSTTSRLNLELRFLILVFLLFSDENARVAMELGRTHQALDMSV
jgi:hypothetical protein